MEGPNLLDDSDFVCSQKEKQQLWTRSEESVQFTTDKCLRSVSRLINKLIKLGH